MIKNKHLKNISINTIKNRPHVQTMKNSLRLPKTMLYIVDSLFQGPPRMQKTLGFATAILLLAIAVTAIAQTVINESPAAQALDAIPTRGMTMEFVEANFGAPRNKRSPIGDPPITRWEYSEFIVYFEYKRVIHSVAKRPIER